MSVHTFGQATFSDITSGGALPTIAGNIDVMSRVAAAFAPHQTRPPSTRIEIDAGSFFSDGLLLEVPCQLSDPIPPPKTLSRVDRAVVNIKTGRLTILVGIEAANPSLPDIPSGWIPVAQILRRVGHLAIDNLHITDERCFIASAGGGLIGVQSFTRSATYLPTSGTKRIYVRLVGGGGSGGNCSATSGSEVSCASGGGAGSYAEAVLDAGFNGVEIEVGKGGASSSSNGLSGNAGGTTRFGDLILAPGGTAGNGSAPYPPPLLWDGGGPSAAPTGASIFGACGASGTAGLALALTIVDAGDGGASLFGGGGKGGGGSAGLPGTAPGAGGGGASAIAGQSGFPGGPGADGIAVIFEYG